VLCGFSGKLCKSLGTADNVLTLHHFKVYILMVLDITVQSRFVLAGFFRIMQFIYV
jgi:hypothetical protein